MMKELLCEILLALGFDPTIETRKRTFWGRKSTPDHMLCSVLCKRVSMCHSPMRNNIDRKPAFQVIHPNLLALLVIVKRQSIDGCIRFATNWDHRHFLRVRAIIDNENWTTNHCFLRTNAISRGQKFPCWEYDYTFSDHTPRTAGQSLEKARHDSGIPKRVERVEKRTKA